MGKKTCGEVEYVMVVTGESFYIGLGSDHTDRGWGMSVPKAGWVHLFGGTILLGLQKKSKHWRPLSYIPIQTVDGEEILYQRGTLAGIPWIRDRF